MCILDVFCERINFRIQFIGVSYEHLQRMTPMDNGAQILFSKREMTWFVVSHPPRCRHQWHGWENRVSDYRYLRESRWIIAAFQIWNVKDWALNIAHINHTVNINRPKVRVFSLLPLLRVLRS